MLAVAVKRQSFALQEFADAPLFGLAPARVIDIRIHVGEEPVFARRRAHPGRDRRFFHQTNAHDGFRAFESVFPRHGQAQRCTILVRQHFPVQTHRHQGQGMLRLVQAQAFHIRPIQHRGALPRHALGVVERGELYKLGAAGGLDALQNFIQGKSNPRNHHRPAFDAAQAIYALFQRQLEQVIHIEGAWALYQSFHSHRPGPGHEIARLDSRACLVGTEFVKVVVRGDVVVGRERFVHGVGGFFDAWQLGGGIRPQRERGKRTHRSRAFNEFAPLVINRWVGDFRGFDVGRTADQHGVAPLPIGRGCGGKLTGFGNEMGRGEACLARYRKRVGHARPLQVLE